jgi:hypothetical protein
MAAGAVMLEAEPRTDERFAATCPVACRHCGATVQVAKFSPQHTSVQWSLSAVDRCEVFSGPPIETCGWMRASIDEAVDSGRVEVTPP